MSEPIEHEDEELDETKTENSDNIESLSEVESNNGSAPSSEHGGGAGNGCDEFETASDNSDRGGGGEGSVADGRNDGTDQLIAGGVSSRKRKHEDDKDEDSGLGSYSGGGGSSGVATSSTTTIHRMPSECESAASGGVGVNSGGSVRIPGSPNSLSDHEYLDATSDPGSGSQSPIVSINPDQLEIRHHKPLSYRSIVTDVFDGKLVSSLKCLSCDRYLYNIFFTLLKATQVMWRTNEMWRH